jgi:tetratricopeptide (TPR) repeat protein
MKMTINTRLSAGTILATLFVALPAGATSLVLPTAAVATAQPSAGAETSAPDTRTEPTPDTVDLAALYYYARNGEAERVDAETRRLELKFPGFSVPADLYAPDAGQQVDETTLWQLYERDDYAGIEEEISRIAASHPGWEPSEDFRSKLERRKLRYAMKKADEAKDFVSVIRLGANLDPAQEAEIDLLWTMLDAYRANDMQEGLASVYRGILFRSSEKAFSNELVLTTLQKAMQDIPAADLREAMQVLSANPELALSMRSLSLDLMRRELGDFASGVADAPRPDPEAIAAVSAAAETGKAPGDLALMGWYMLKIEQPAEAADFFQRLLQNGATPEAVRGMALSLAHQSKDEEAYAFVTSHIDLLAGEDAFLLDQLSFPFKGDGKAEIDERVVTRYSEAIQKTESSDHARLIGWYAYNSRQFGPARGWFEKAFEWKAEADSLKGLALSLTRLGEKKAFAELREKQGETYQSVFAELKSTSEPRDRTGKPVSAPAGVQAGYLSRLEKKDYGGCVAELRRLEARTALRPDAQVAKGWCLLGLNHLAEARQAFATGLAGGGGKADDAAYGLGLALLRANLTDDAEALLMQQRLTPLRDRELRAEVLWQRARAAFDRKQYRVTLDALNTRLQIMPEPVGISQMRAWSHYHLGNLAQSRAIFAQLNQVMADPANTRGIAAINERMGIER